MVYEMETRCEEGKFILVEGVQHPNLEILICQIDTQRCVVEVFRSSLEEKGGEFDKVRQGDGGITNVIEVLRKEAIWGTSHNEAAKTLCLQLEKRSSIFRSMQPQPWLDLQRSETPDYLRIENCTFCGLGFNPVWTARSASCQHIYQEWCCRFVFEASTTCVAARCGAEMHEGWWACSGFIKLEASGCLGNSEDRATGKTLA